jgi:hypothetical protein
VLDAGDCKAFKLWSGDKTHHLAYASVAGDVILIGVRVFDIYAAVVTVTSNGGPYDAAAKLRFLTIEPSTGTMRDTSVMDECSRMALAMITPLEGVDS